VLSVVWCLLLPSSLSATVGRATASCGRASLLKCRHMSAVTDAVYLIMSANILIFWW